MKRSATTGEKGFLLLETLVSALLLAVALVALVGAINQNIRAGMLVRDRSTAMFLAQSLMTEMENQLIWKNDYSGIRRNGSFEAPNAKFRYAIEIDRVEDISEFRVNVAVSWDFLNTEQRFWLHQVFPMDRVDDYLK